MTILVVDAIDNMRVTVARMITAMNPKEVIQSTNGADALNLLRKHHVDVVITELQLPKLDGIELLKTVRSDDKLADIPVLIMSATIEQSEVVEAIKSGVSEYLVKPFSAKMLSQRLVRAIEKPVRRPKSNKTSNGDLYKSNDAEKKQPLKILVVDDVIDNIQIISDILRKEYSVKAATSGQKALDICNGDAAPDLVLLDIMMPQMDGFEVCKQLKENPDTAHISIIFLTAMDQTQDIVKGFELGAVDYITKPINPEVVKARVATHSKLAKTNSLMREQIDNLMESERMRDEFERIMQNDLKRPVEEIYKCIDLLDRYHRDPDRVKANTVSLKLSTANLTNMIDNMLTLNKLEDGSYHLCPIKLDLHSIIQEVIDTFRVSAQEKRLELQFEVPRGTYVKGEEMLSASLLGNLLKNAIEAAPRGSAIAITHEQKPNFETVAIHNHGAVAEQIRGKFFEKYVSYGKKDSPGIGTYAAKLMTEVQLGSISFETSPEHGTTLFIALPRSKNKE
ncbi:response regulator [Pseudoalteromonas sp. SSDWG2]|uniref:response regulator n=1 Tax=Pseudoalteromonas sp. SSDWG2 TaxID=3139391 RepID=UPI003BA8487A